MSRVADLPKYGVKYGVSVSATEQAGDVIMYGKYGDYLCPPVAPGSLASRVALVGGGHGELSIVYRVSWGYLASFTCALLVSC